MRRVVLSVLALTIGAAVLIGLKARGGLADPALVASSDADPGAGPANGTSASGQPPSGQPAPGSAAPSASASGGTAASPGPGQSSGGGTTTTAAPPPPPASRTLTGTAVAAKSYGSMQVRIVVTGTHIDSISTIKQSNQPGNTATKLTPLALSAQAVPNVTCSTTVSGATYSCQAWLQSLQTAIGQI